MRNDKKLDNNQNDDIITLVSKTGEEIKFIIIAAIGWQGKQYAILQPVELFALMDDDEALVFRVSKNKDNLDTFDIELDDDVINNVFAEYNKLYDQTFQDGKTEN